MPVWQCAPFLMQTWEGETVVFQRESGDTHLVDELTARVLRCLEGGPLAETRLADCLALRVEPDFQEMLRHLESSGLISCRTA